MHQPTSSCWVVHQGDWGVIWLCVPYSVVFRLALLCPILLCPPLPSPPLTYLALPCLSMSRSVLSTLPNFTVTEYSRWMNFTCGERDRKREVRGEGDLCEFESHWQQQRHAIDSEWVNNEEVHQPQWLKTKELQPTPAFSLSTVFRSTLPFPKVLPFCV